MHRFVRAVAVVMGCLLGASACQEDLSGGAACPALCPEQRVQVRDTLLFPLAVDSTLFGYPTLGTSGILLLAWYGDTLQTGAVIRFDSVARALPPRGSEQREIAGVESANLSVQLTGRNQATAAVTFSVYDVTTTARDLDTAAVRSLFRPDRLIGTRTIPRDSLVDTVTRVLRIPLSPPAVERKLSAGERFRLGISITSDSSTNLRLLSREGTGASTLSYTVRTSLDLPTLRDTLTLSNNPLSIASSDLEASGLNLADYTISLRGSASIPPGTFAVGGFPATRAYLRFALPSAIIDSTTIVRASLVLTQRPNRGPGFADTLRIVPLVVLASPLIEPGRAALLSTAPEPLGVQRLVIVPRDSGQRTIDIATLIERVWKLQDASKVQRALALQSNLEGIGPARVLFFSNEELVDSLRPRLRISYIPPARFGLP